MCCVDGGGVAGRCQRCVDVGGGGAANTHHVAFVVDWLLHRILYSKETPRRRRARTACGSGTRASVCSASPRSSAPRVILRRLRLFAGGAFCFRRTREVSRRRIVVPGLSRGPWRAQARNQKGGADTSACGLNKHTSAGEVRCISSDGPSLLSVLSILCPLSSKDQAGALHL